MKTLSIYKGAGASPTNAKLLRQAFSEALHPFGTQIRYIYHDDLNDPTQKWRDETDVLVIGGGAYGQVKAALTGSARQGIYDFALEKTTIGICMGGYGLSASTFFVGEDIHKTSDGIGAFNGRAKGCLPVTPAAYNGNSNSAGIITLYHQERGLSFPALYWGGPSFEIMDATDPSVTPLATIKVDYTDTPLVMAVRVEQAQGGRSLLVGYHGEATKPSYVSSWVEKFKSSQEDLNRIEREIAGHSKGKYYLGFAALLDDAGLIPGYSFVDHILNKPLPREITAPLQPSRGQAPEATVA